MTSEGQGGGSPITARGGYWTGPVLAGVQYGWRVEWANGPFGRPGYHGYGNDEAEALADLTAKISQDGLEWRDA